MFNRHPLAAFLVLALCACSSAPSSHQVQVPPDFVVERVKQRFEVAPAVTRLRIRNRWGDVHLKSMHGDGIGIYAVVQRIGDGAPAPRFDFRNEGEYATLEVAYAAPFAEGTSGRVDLAVYLPPLADIDVETDAGLIRGKELSANLSADSRRGNILVSSSGRLRLATQSGEIHAIQIGGKWIGDAFLTSVSGLVELSIPADSEVVLDARSAAGVTEEFGEALHAVSRTPTHLRGELGSGEVKLQMRVRSQSEVILRPFYQ